MNIIIGSCFIALVLIIWFRTNAFVEYIELFKLTRFFKVDQYLIVGIDNSFPEFLKEYYDCFLTRLLSCPICTSVWLGFFTSIFTGLLVYPVITLFGLFLYLIISKLL